MAGVGPSWPGRVGALAQRRRRLPFRQVNRRDDPGFQPGMQRHHLLPHALLAARPFGPLFERIGREWIDF